MLCRPLKISAHHSIAFFDHRYMASSTHRHPGRSLHITTNAGTNVVMCRGGSREMDPTTYNMTENIILRRVLFHLVASAGGGGRHIENPPPPPWRTWTSLRSRRRRECRNQSLDIPTHVTDRSAPKGYLICKYYSLDIK